MGAKVMCIYWESEFNNCNKKPRVFFGLFKQRCTQLYNCGQSTCALQKFTEYEQRPEPTKPSPKRIINEDVQIIEGKWKLRPASSGTPMPKVKSPLKHNYCFNCGQKLNKES